MPSSAIAFWQAKFTCFDNCISLHIWQCSPTATHISSPLTTSFLAITGQPFFLREHSKVLILKIHYIYIVMKILCFWKRESVSLNLYVFRTTKQMKLLLCQILASITVKIRPLQYYNVLQRTLVFPNKYEYTLIEMHMLPLLTAWLTITQKSLKIVTEDYS